MKKEYKVVDLHCDTITECMKQNLHLINNSLHFSLDKIPPNTHWCQCMAVFMPDELRGQAAIDYFNAAYSYYCSELDLHASQITPITEPEHLDQSLTQAACSVMLTVEGGSVLAGSLEILEQLHRIGVAMMTLTWNAENEICGGAATDVGFSDFGRNVVSRMEELSMIVDVSHLSDRGFWELCDFAAKPFVASHSNSRVVCNHRRNLTDDMFAELVRRSGLVGLNYYDEFIRQGGGTRSITDLLRHVHHFLDQGGEDILSLGSDYDGADLPEYIDGVEKSLYLFDEMERSGIPEKIIHKILYKNPCRFFRENGGRS